MKKATLLLALTACSGSGGGLPFTPNTQLAIPTRFFSDGGPDPSFVTLAIAAIDQGPLDCGDSFDGGFPVTGTTLEIAVGNTDGSALTAGTYPIVLNVFIFDGGAGASLLLTSTADGVIATGQSGTVTLTSAGSTIAGSLKANVAEANGYPSTLSADFSAPLCLP